MPPAAELRRLLRRAVVETLITEGVNNAEVSVTLLGDEDIVKLNRRYLGRDYPPDVLSFALHAAGEDPSGDIYIGFDQALRQAAEHEQTAARELARLAIHGTLHVLGHDHPEGADRIASAMWTRQEAILDRVAAD
ncbi:MAG TPA: rRNA maturation RNase YbeY [Longimicrobiales bacterium]|nr:rRNA maturation RNase YbeY [Longimicrobiales bacterium]